MAWNLALVLGAFSVSRRARNRRSATAISIMPVRPLSLTLSPVGERRDLWLEEVDQLLAPVPDHSRLCGFGARHHLPAAQHELARSDKTDSVHLGRGGEDAKVGLAAWLQPVALEPEGAGRVA